jgi:hypothetical protein
MIQPHGFRENLYLFAILSVAMDLLKNFVYCKIASALRSAWQIGEYEIFTQSQ